MLTHWCDVSRTWWYGTFSMTPLQMRAFPLLRISLHVQRLYAKNNNNKYAIEGGRGRGKGMGQELERNLVSFSWVEKAQSIQCCAKMQFFFNTFIIQLELWESENLIIVTWFSSSQLSDDSELQLSLLSLLCLWNVFATFFMDTNCIFASTLSSSSDSWERGKFVRTFLRF